MVKNINIFIQEIGEIEKRLIGLKQKLFKEQVKEVIDKKDWLSINTILIKKGKARRGDVYRIILIKDIKADENGVIVQAQPLKKDLQPNARFDIVSLPLVVLNEYEKMK